MENCTCCFVDTLAKCETGIKLNIILPPYMNYKWVITDKFGNKYEGQLNEELTIPVEDLPPGMLNQYAGEFTLQIFPDTDQPCGPVTFIVAGQYHCINFGITGGTFEKNNLGCEV